MKIYDASGFDSKLTGSFTGSFTGDGTNLTGVLHNSGEIASDISGSVTSLSASIATRFDGLTSDYTELTNIPSGIISSSNQFNALSNTSASFSTTASYALNAGGGAGFPFVGQADITGSLYVSGGNISGSFKGDGSQLTNLNFHIVSSSIIEDSFTSAPSHSVSHNFGTKNVHISVYEGDTVFIPNSIVTTDNNTVDVVFGSIITGRIVVSKGGHIVSGSTDFNNIINTPTLVSSSTFPYTGSAILSGSLTVTGSLVVTGTAFVTSSKVYNNNTSSGSISFWQGSQTEYDAISSSADPNTVYFVI